MQGLNIDEREQICRKCPIFNPTDVTCNSRLWIDPDTDEVSTTQKSGYIRGCGCILKFKWVNLSNHCIAGKW